jgi:hypothetical protein
MLKVAFFGNKASVDDAVNITDGMWSVYIPQLVANNLVPYINSNSGTPLGAGDGIDLLLRYGRIALTYFQQYRKHKRYF